MDRYCLNICVLDLHTGLGVLPVCAVYLLGGLLGRSQE